MTEKRQEERDAFYKEVADQQKRARQARKEGDRTLREGLGSFGMIGWSVAAPMLLGIAIGVWLDRRSGGGLRFTLSLLLVGIATGMVNAWKWMHRP